MTRDELALEAEHLDLLEANQAAKDAYRANPSPATKAAKEAAGQALQEFRTLWRGIRAYNNPAPAADDGVARPKTAKVSTTTAQV